MRAGATHRTAGALSLPRWLGPDSIGKVGKAFWITEERDTNICQPVPTKPVWCVGTAAFANAPTTKQRVGDHEAMLVGPCRVGGVTTVRPLWKSSFCGS